MRTDLFDYDLSPDRIATHPAEPRESAKLLRVQGEALSDHTIADLPDLLRPDDLLVFNNTKVIPAHLRGKRGDATIDLTLHKQLSPTEWAAFAKPAKKLAVGDIVTIAEQFSVTVLEKREGGEVLLEGDAHFLENILAHGTMPLPPYILKARDEKSANDDDVSLYQTVFAKHEGAVAAPTAGLHFTESLLNQLVEKAVESVFVTLHVGGGTFLPVKAEDTDDHIMHSEWCEIDENTANRINEAKKAGRRIVAIGTTALRVLEASAQKTGKVGPFLGETDIFITPGYQFLAIDALFTNFHLPKSTLFMLISAFSGLEVIKKAYNHAISHDYRFYSYGDACLLERGS